MITVQWTHRPHPDVDLALTGRQRPHGDDVARTPDRSAPTTPHEAHPTPMTPSPDAPASSTNGMTAGAAAHTPTAPVGVPASRGGIPRGLLRPAVRTIVTTMAPNLDRAWRIREVAEHTMLPLNDVVAAFAVFARHNVVHNDGTRSGRRLLTPAGLYLHTILEQQHPANSSDSSAHNPDGANPADVAAIAVWPPPAPTGANEGHLDLPVAAGSAGLAVFTPTMRQLTAVLATRLGHDLSVRDLSDDSGVTLGTAGFLLTRLAKTGLAHVTGDRNRGHRYRLTTVGLYLHTLAQQRPATRRATTDTAQPQWSTWQPPIVVDPDSIDMLLVHRLHSWLDRHGGETTRTEIRRKCVAGATSREATDRLLAHFAHVHPGTIHVRTTAGRRAVVIHAPHTAPPVIEGRQRRARPATTRRHSPRPTRITNLTLPLPAGIPLATEARTKLGHDAAQRYQSGQSVDTIANAYGRSYSFTHTLLVEAGVRLRPPGMPRRPRPDTTTATSKEAAGCLSTSAS